MKKQFAIALVALGIVQFAFGEVKTVSYTLPDDYTKAQIVESNKPGYSLIQYPGVDYPVDEVGAPMLPDDSVTFAVPKNGKLLDCEFEAEWVTIGEDVRLIPIQEPVSKMVKNPPFTPPNDALYGTVSPKKQVESLGVQIASGVEILPVRFIPFRYTNGKLEAAKSFTIKATFLVPEQMMSLSTSKGNGYAKDLVDQVKGSVVNPEEIKEEKAPQKMSLFSLTDDPNPDFDAIKDAAGDSEQPDYIVIAPNKYYSLWVKYVEARKAAHPEMKFRCDNFNTILAAFPVNTDDSTKGYYARNDAERLHAYIRQEAAKGTHYFVLAGAFYDAHGYPEGGVVRTTKRDITITAPDVWYTIGPETGIPGIYTIPSSQKSFNLGQAPIPTDAFYACCDLKGAKYPWDAGSENGAITEGDGIYANEHSDIIDLIPDVVVTRIAFKLANNDDPSASGRTYEQTFNNYLAKVQRVEQANFPGRRRYAVAAGALGSNSPDMTSGSTHRFDIEYYTGGYNMYDIRHPSKWVDTEYTMTWLMRDRMVRGLPSAEVGIASETNWKVGLTEFDQGANYLRDHDWDLITVDSHGSQSGLSSKVFYGKVSQTMKGLIRSFIAGRPCLTGYPDYREETHHYAKACHCDMLLENPTGGAVFAVGSAREGWYSNATANIDDGDNYNSKLDNLSIKAYFINHLSPGDSWLYMMRNFQNQLGSWGARRWSWVCPIAYGDPLPFNYALEDYTWAGETTGEVNWNLTDSLWTTNGVLCVYDHANTAIVEATGNLTMNVGTNELAALALDVTQPSDAAFKLTGDESGRLRLGTDLKLNAGTFVAAVEGGVGHEGLQFTEAKGNVRFEGNKKFYLGKVKNVDTVTFAGSNGLLDFRKGKATTNDPSDNNEEWIDVDHLVFEGSGVDVNTHNVLRGTLEGALAKYLPLSIENFELQLETFNAFKNATAEKLMTVKNGRVIVHTNPNYGKSRAQTFEAFVLPVELDNGEIRVDRTHDFSFGSETSPGLELSVKGNSKLSRSNNASLGLYGVTKVMLDDEANLEINVEIVDFGNGGFEFSGNGKVKIVGMNSLAGEVTVRAGTTVEFANLPLAKVTKLTLEEGAKVILPKSDNNTYQITPLIGAQLDNQGAVFYNGALENPIVGTTTVTGSFFDPDTILTWNGPNGGDWSATEQNWLKGGTASAFTGNIGTYFPDNGNCTINVVGDQNSLVGSFANANSAYVFNPNDATSKLNFQGLSIGGDVTFNLPVSSSGALHVMGGKTEVNTDAKSPAMNTREIHIYDGAEYGASSTGFIIDKISYIRIYFLAQRNSANVPHEGVKIDEISFSNVDANGNITSRLLSNNVKSVSSSVSTSNLGRLYDGSYNASSSTGGNDGYSVYFYGSAAVMAGEGLYVTFELREPRPVFDRFGVFSSKTYNAETGSSWDGYRPTSFRVDVSADGINWTTVARTSNSNSGFWYGGWVGGDEKSGEAALRAGSSGEQPASVEVREGGTLLAEGKIRANIEAASGSILKAVNGKSLECAENTVWSFGEEPVIVDVSDLTLTSTPQPIVSGGNLDFYSLYNFKPNNENASLRYRDGVISVVKGDGLVAPYLRTFAGTENEKWDTDDWRVIDYDENGEIKYDENSEVVTKPFGGKWSEKSLDENVDIALDMSADAVVTVDADVICDTLRATDLKYVGGYKLKLVDDGTHTINAKTLDFSDFTGEVDYGLNCGDAHVIAGTMTRLSGNGRGVLTVDTMNTVILSAPWDGTIEGNGTIVLDPGEGNSWDDMRIFALNRNLTVELMSGTMTIPEGTSIAVNRISCGSGAKIVTTPTSESWVLSNKTLEIREGGELIFNINSADWGTNVSFNKISGSGSIVYENKTGSALTTLGRKIPGTMTVVMRDGVYNLTSSSELEVALNAARIVVSEGAEFSADSVGNTDGQYKYLRMKFLNSGKTLKIAEIGVRRNNQFQSLKNSTVTCNVSGSSNLGYLVDNPNTDFFNEMWNGAAATIPGNATITIELKSPLSMFSNYSMGIGPQANCPTSWDMEVSEDGVNYVLVSSVRNTTASGQWNWMGGGNSGAFRASKPADLTIAAGGALLAKGNLETIVKFEDGAIIKPTAGETMTLVGNSNLILPESGTVTIDVRGAVSAGVGETVDLISGKKFTEDDLKKFTVLADKTGYRLVLGEDGSLKLTRTHFAPRIIVK